MAGRTHHFTAGPHRTWDGRPICSDCGMPESSRIHQVPERSEEEQAVEARRMGEGEAGRRSAGQG